MRQIVRTLVGVCVVASAATAAAAQQTGYEDLADWSRLPHARTGVTAGMASSWDRNGYNSDFNWYQEPNTFQDGNCETVIATLTGPGVLTRFWMPHAAADERFTVKITVDGVVRIDTDSNSLLDGTSGGPDGIIRAPLVQTLVGGQVSYEPIAFQNSLMIESNNYGDGVWARTHHYYQYSYNLLPASTTVTPYTGVLTPAQQSARAAAVSVIDNAGANPAGGGGAVLAQPAASIAAGESLTLADLSGTGRIRRLNVKMDGATDAELDGLRVRVRYDGQPGPAIDVPVSEFFGVGHERAAYQSLPLGTDANDGFYSYWPMPYRNGAVVELYNAGAGGAISLDSAAVEYEAGQVAPDEGNFHAVCRQNEMVDWEDHEYHQLLNVSGAGHYVGNLLWVRNPDIARKILEGDDVILVDGEQVLYGTGLEDAYNGGYYYNHIVTQSDDGDVPLPESGTGPLSGLLHMDDADFGDTFVRADQYRWMISDAVGFTDGIEVLQENNRGYAGRDFGSTAFYYLLPIPGDADLDRTVTAADLSLLADHWGQTGGAAWVDSDFTGDGAVSAADLSLLADNWGYGTVGGAVSAPEPGAVLVATIGALAVLVRRRRKA